MPLPDLSPYPIWAQVLIYSILGVALALAFVVTRFGIAQGQKAAPATASQAQVAAVIVDPTALNHASAAAEGLTVALTEANTIARGHVIVTDRLAERVEQLGDAVDRLTREATIMAAKGK